MRIVIDTNVLISAIFWTGQPKQILNRVRNGELTFLASESLLNELREVLIRGDKPFRLSGEEAERIVTEMRELAEIIETNTQVDLCKHENDNRVLECAVDGGAECIITGDLDLLKLKSYKKVKIMMVRDFLTGRKGKKG